jgi:hypothetical protein
VDGIWVIYGVIKTSSEPNPESIHIAFESSHPGIGPGSLLEVIINQSANQIEWKEHITSMDLCVRSAETFSLSPLLPLPSSSTCKSCQKPAI